MYPATERTLPCNVSLIGGYIVGLKGRQYYNNSVYIDGRTDYIFGDATAYL